MDYNNIDELRETIDELNKKLQLLENGKEAICDMILKGKQFLYCPRCGSVNIDKNGKPNNKQNYICKDCNKKFNILTNTIFHHTHLSYAKIEKAIDCIIHLFSIRKMASIVKIYN